MISKPVITKKPRRGARLVDAHTSSIKELFIIRNPKWKDKGVGFEEAFAEFKKKNKIPAVFVFYPTENLTVKTFPEKEYIELLTARNRNIINEEEQRKYRAIKVGIIGLSVGSGIAHALVMTGGPKFLKIADFDSVEISNLNRMRAGLKDVGINKTKVAADFLWSINPFLDLELWEDGVKSDSLKQFLTGKGKLGVFIDEMDSLDLKIRSRLLCREFGIPVVMATSNGDGVILDVERYDLDKKLRLFNGLIEEPDPDKLQSLNYKDWLKMALKIVGPKYLSERMQESTLIAGSKISGVPQLGATVNMAAAGICFIVRRISSGYEMPSGRYTFGLEEKLVPGYGSTKNKAERNKKTKNYIQSINEKYKF